jgi:hypothetical protein
MLKLYRFANGKKEYWETWADDRGTHTVHWGILGTKGETKVVKSSLFRKAESSIQKDIDRLIVDGFHPIDADDHATLMIEYAIDDTCGASDVDKRHRLEGKMNELLGWTGLGFCDGGSIGSGTMEVCNFVVDFDLAKRIIEENLAGTEFGNFTRIYDENATING